MCDVLLRPRESERRICPNPAAHAAGNIERAEDALEVCARVLAAAIGVHEHGLEWQAISDSHSKRVADEVCGQSWLNRPDSIF